MATLLNPLTEYRNAGKRAAMAVRNHDMANAQYWNDWLTRALAREDQSNKSLCSETWHAAYREESGLLGGMIHRY